MSVSGPINISMFMRELFVISFITSVSTYPRRFSKFKFTKIVANYIQDCKESLGLRYRPNSLIEEHPFGIVSKIKFVMRHSEDIHIFDMQFLNLGADNGLWKIYRMPNNHIEIEMLKNPKELKELLLNGSDRYEFLKVRMFSEPVLLQMESLGEIYSHLNTGDLNILATHRNVHNSYQCLKLVSRLWFSVAFDLIKNLIKKKNTNIYNLAEKVVDYSLQINDKSNQVIYGLPNLINKLSTLKDNLNKTASTVCNAILTSLKENGAHTENTYIGPLESRYIITQNLIIPISRALLEYIINQSVFSHIVSGIQGFLNKLNTHSHIPDENYEEIKPSLISLNLEEIKRFYNNAKDQIGKNFSKRITYRKRRRRTSWLDCKSN